MRPTRRSQPYRKGAETRTGGSALSAMLKGRPAFMPNPQQLHRDLHRTSRHMAGAMRKKRK
jgi:hypothetical protein